MVRTEQKGKEIAGKRSGSESPRRRVSIKPGQSSSNPQGANLKRTRSFPDQEALIPVDHNLNHNLSGSVPEAFNDSAGGFDLCPGGFENAPEATAEKRFINAGESQSVTAQSEPQRLLTPQQIFLLENYDLTAWDMRDHNWDSDTGKESVEYIDEQMRYGTAQEAMNEIRGCSADEIRFMNIWTLSRQDMRDHNWRDPETLAETENYMENTVKFSDVTGKEIKILYNRHLYCKDNVSTRSRDQKFRLRETDNEEDNDEDNEVTPQNVMDAIRGLNGEEIRSLNDLSPAQIRLFRFHHLSREDMAGHNWSNPETGRQSEHYITHRPEGVSAQAAMAAICGLNAPQIRLHRAYGLSREDMAGHDWTDPTTVRETEIHIANRPEDLTTQAAMAAICGLNAPQIRLHRNHGLNREDTHSHNWNSPETALQTEAYIANRPAGATPQEAMETIRGLTWQEIILINMFKCVKNEKSYTDILENINTIPLKGGRKFATLKKARDRIADFESRQERVLKKAFQKETIIPAEIEGDEEKIVLEETELTASEILSCKLEEAERKYPQTLEIVSSAKTIEGIFSDLKKIYPREVFKTPEEARDFIAGVEVAHPDATPKIVFRKKSVIYPEILKGEKMILGRVKLSASEILDFKMARERTKGLYEEMRDQSAESHEET